MVGCRRRLGPCAPQVSRPEAALPAGRPSFHPHAGLSRLTCLKLTGARQFGGWALRSLQALSTLRRLTLSGTALHPDDLAAHRDACSSDSDEEHARPEQWRSAGLPPALTCLQLWDNAGLRCGGRLRLGRSWPCGARGTRAMSRRRAAVESPAHCRPTPAAIPPALARSPDAVARLAASLPSLRRLALRGSPLLQRRHLELVLQQCTGLRLLQTDWQPNVDPGEPEAGTEADCAFCEAWRLRLQHRRALLGWAKVGARVERARRWRAHAGATGHLASASAFGPPGSDVISLHAPRDLPCSLPQIGVRLSANELRLEGDQYEVAHPRQDAETGEELAAELAALEAAGASGGGGGSGWQ